MRRRALITAFSAGWISLSGCLSRDADEDGTAGETNNSEGDETNDSEENETATDTSDDTESSDESTDRRYKECPREVIPYEQFPAEIQTEIDAALEGEYRAERVFLREAMDTEASYVSVDGQYYDATVTEDGDEEVLTLELVEPKALPEARSVRVEHGFDGERTITLEIVAEDGTVLIDETRTLRPTATVEFGTVARVGEHDIYVTVADGDQVEAELTGTLRIDEYRFRRIVVVEPDGLSVTGTIAELGVCQFDE